MAERAFFPSQLHDHHLQQQYADEQHSSFVAEPGKNAASSSYASSSSSSLHDHHHHEPHGYLHLIDELRNSAMLKAEIVSHPLYENLLRAHVQCLSVGLPADHVRALEAQLANKHSVAIKYLMLGKEQCAAHVNGQDMNMLRGCRKEIDEFMENYLQLLISLKKHMEELIIPPTIKAMDALCELERAFCELTGTSPKEISSAINLEPELEDINFVLEMDDADSGVESQCDIDRSLLEHVRMELKHKLKESYRDNLAAIRDEIIRKRQAGKLPGDVTILKKWWNAHSKWPYPTEEEKKRMVQETGLEMRQINNWFINHRKRNWSDRVTTNNVPSTGSTSGQ